MTELHFRGVRLIASDEEGSLSLGRIANELACDVYGLHRIPFQPGDIVIDIGAHAGLVSMYLAKQWPFLEIHAFEPHPASHRHCEENLLCNGVSNVHLHHKAVNADGRLVTLRWAGTNTGGATAAFDIPDCRIAGPVDATTLDRILDEALAPDRRCRLLKIDCEGMEYEILQRSRQLHRIDYLAAEFHIASAGVSALGARNPGDPQALFEFCARTFPRERMRVRVCEKED